MTLFHTLYLKFLGPDHCTSWNWQQKRDPCWHNQIADLFHINLIPSDYLYQFSSSPMPQSKSNSLVISLVKSMMETNPVFKMMYLKKLKTIDYVQNNSHIFCNIKTYVCDGSSLLTVNPKTWEKYCWAEGCEWNDSRKYIYGSVYYYRPCYVSFWNRDPLRLININVVFQ
jgi:hypothetical protein